MTLSLNTKTDEYLSPRASPHSRLRPRQSLPDPILFSIISYYPVHLHSAPNSSPHLLPSSSRLPLPPTVTLHTTHDISSSTSFRPLQTLPHPILFTIIAYYLPAMHFTPHILPPSRTLISTLEPTTLPRPPRRLTVSILAKSRPPVSHTCVANPYDLISSS